MGMGAYGKVQIGSTVRQTTGADNAIKRNIIEREGTRGTLAHNVKDTREGTYSVNPTIPLEPSGVDLAADIVWALGTDDVLTPGDVILDLVTECYKLNDCVPDVLTIAWAQGGKITETLELVGKTSEEDDAIATDPDEEEPLMAFDVSLTINSVTCTPFEGTFKINHAIDKTRFLNSQTLVDLVPQDRLITLDVTLPYDDIHEPLYDAVKAEAGVAASLVIAGCGTFTLNVQDAPDLPKLDKTETKLMLKLICRISDSGATDDCSFVSSGGS
jgi:hypothetical protein